MYKFSLTWKTLQFLAVKIHPVVFSVDPIFDCDRRPFFSFRCQKWEFALDQEVQPECLVQITHVPHYVLQPIFIAPFATAIILTDVTRPKADWIRKWQTGIAQTVNSFCFHLSADNDSNCMLLKINCNMHNQNTTESRLPDINGFDRWSDYRKFWIRGNSSKKLALENFWISPCVFLVLTRNG